MGGLNQNTIIMEAKILRIEGQYEIIGYFLNGVKIKETRRLVTNWK
jgi:hypothetical protein